MMICREDKRGLFLDDHDDQGFVKQALTHMIWPVTMPLKPANPECKCLKVLQLFGFAEGVSHLSKPFLC